jgi:hypothetical protein
VTPYSYGIFEDIGCLVVTSYTVPAILLFNAWPLGIGCVSFVYCCTYALLTFAFYSSSSFIDSYDTVSFHRAQAQAGGGNGIAPRPATESLHSLDAAVLFRDAYSSSVLLIFAEHYLEARFVQVQLVHPPPQLHPRSSVLNHRMAE